MSGFKVQVTADSMEDLYKELAESRPLLFGDVELNRAARSALQAGLDWLGHGKSKEKLLQLEHRLDILSRQVDQRMAGGQFTLDFPGAPAKEPGDAIKAGDPGAIAEEADGPAEELDTTGSESTAVDAGELADEAWMEKLREGVLAAFAGASHEDEGVAISDSGALVKGGQVLNPEVVEVGPWEESTDVLCLLLYSQDNDGKFHSGSLLAVRNVGVVASRAVVFKDIGGYETADDACKAEAKLVNADLRWLVAEKKLDANAPKVFAAWKRELFPDPKKKTGKTEKGDGAGEESQ